MRRECKTVTIALDGGHLNGSSTGFHLTLTDRSSRKLIADMVIDPSTFYRLIAGHGALPVEARVFDTFEDLGKTPEHKTVVLQDDRLSEWNFDDYQSIADANSGHAIDGWEFIIPSRHSLSQGQVNRVRRTVKMQMVRYMPTREWELSGEAVNVLNAFRESSYVLRTAVGVANETGYEAGALSEYLNELRRAELIEDVERNGRPYMYLTTRAHTLNEVTRQAIERGANNA